MTGISGWTLVVEVPKEAVEIFDQAFSPTFSVDRPNETAVVGAVALAAELAGIP